MVVSKYAFAVYIHVLLNVLICVISHNALVRCVSTSHCQAIYTALLSSRHDRIYMHRYVGGNVDVQVVCAVLCSACVACVV